MGARWTIPILLFCCASLTAQAPATAAAPAPNGSEIGLNFTLPSDWDVVNAQPKLPEAQQQATSDATSEDEKRSIGCVRIVLTARHGAPPSVVVVTAMPFDCKGQMLTEKDLPGLAAGAMMGMAKSFEVSDAVFGAYSLGSHKLWIERATGVPRGHPESKYTVEIVCTLLKKAAVCWMVIAADDSMLQTVEHVVVSLDGEAAAALVPSTAFDKKPTP